MEVPVTDKVLFIVVLARLTKFLRELVPVTLKVLLKVELAKICVPVQV